LPFTDATGEIARRDIPKNCAPANTTSARRDGSAARIYVIRSQRVVLDTHLAELYEVPTFRLNEAVKRNSNRFPKDFMFQLTADEANL